MTLLESSTQWWLYIIKASDQSLYTGVTKNPLRRYRQHCGELAGGAKYFRGRQAISIELLQPMNDQSSALRQEAQIKKLTRNQKLMCISESDTHYRDELRKLLLMRETQ